MNVSYFAYMLAEAEREFDERMIAAEPVREVVERAEHAILRLIEVDPMTADEADRKDAVLSRVMAEGLFPALVGRNSETPADGFERQDLQA